MSRNLHENRFIERLQFAVGEAEVAQELSIPRKARRLDAVCQFTDAPELFGALRGVCDKTSKAVGCVPCSLTPTCLSASCSRYRRLS